MRGGLYLVSKNGFYGHADGVLSGRDAEPISIDLLTQVLGGFSDNENAVETIKEMFTSPKLSEQALKALETIKKYSRDI